MPNSNEAKSERHKMMDPRMGQITKNNSMIPGGPDTNTPITALQSEGTPIQAQSLYMDYPQNDLIYPQLGTRSIDPTKVDRSQLLQGNVVMQKLNAGQPFNMQQQFDLSGQSPVADMQEAARLNMRAPEGTPQSPMGISGSPAIPGGMPPNMPGTTGPQFMQSMSPDNGAMVPGSTPQKKGKNPRGKK